MGANKPRFLQFRNQSLSSRGHLGQSPGKILHYFQASVIGAAFASPEFN